MTNLLETVSNRVEIENSFKRAESLEIWDYLSRLTSELGLNVEFQKQKSRIVLWKRVNERRRIRLMTVVPSVRKKQVSMYNYPEIQETSESRKVLNHDNYREELLKAFQNIAESIS